MLRGTVIVWLSSQWTFTPPFLLTCSTIPRHLPGCCAEKGTSFFRTFVSKCVDSVDTRSPLFIARRLCRQVHFVLSSKWRCLSKRTFLGWTSVERSEVAGPVVTAFSWLFIVAFGGSFLDVVASGGARKFCVDTGLVLMSLVCCSMT